MKKLILLLIVLLSLSALSACAGTTEAEQDTLIMATNAEFPPFQFYQGEEIVGLDIDFANAIGERIGKNIEVRDMAFDAIIPAVQSGRADFGMAGMTVTEERSLLVDFSIAYYTGRQVVIVREDEDEIHTIDDLDGRMIGVQLGTTGDMYVTWDFGEESVQRYSRGFEAVQALAQGRIDAVVIDDQPAAEFVAATEGLRILETEYVEEDYAIAFALGSPWVEPFNQAIQDLKEDGTFQIIVDRYIGQEPNEGATTFAARFYRTFVEYGRWRLILNGLGMTLQITLFSVIIGTGIGFFVSIIRATADKRKKRGFFDSLCRIYLTVVRGTPVLVQLMIIYFVIFSGIDINTTLVAVIAFGLNSGAYVAEIFRSGIMAIDEGQFEAGRSLGLSYRQTMFSIIMPQAFKKVLPALANEFIVLLKETSIVGFIAVQDLTRAGDIIRSRTFDAYFPLLSVGLIYLLLVLGFTKLVSLLERRLRNSER